MSEKLLTKKEAAEYLGVAEKRIDDLVIAGKLPAFKIGDKFLRFKGEHLDAVRHELYAPVVRKKDTGTYRNGTAKDRIMDLFYFTDFYIISSIIILGLIAYIIFF